MSRQSGSEQQRFLDINKASWDRIARSTKGRTALPDYGPLCPDEDELKLLGDVSNKKVVELGCGDGQSLAYLHARGAGELWGLDLSPEQVRNASARASTEGFSATLCCSAMEHDPGIPHDYFDLALSLYALGWAVDIHAALGNVASYLRPGGVFVFSWEHPFFSCLKSDRERLYVDRSYSQVGAVQSRSWNGDPIVMQARKLSDFLNAVIDSGLVLERIVEGELREQSRDRDYPRRWYNKERARLVPTTLIVKARKSP